MPIADPVLPILQDVERSLKDYVEPVPLITTPVASVDPNDIAQWKAANADVQSAADPIQDLLTKLYEVEFIQETGHAIGTVLLEVGDILRKIADILESAAGVTGGVQALENVLVAIRKIPGSPEALTTASEFLAQMIDLLHDVPSAQAELYMIAQQITTVASIFNATVLIP